MDKSVGMQGWMSPRGSDAFRTLSTEPDPRGSRVDFKPGDPVMRTINRTRTGTAYRNSKQETELAILYPAENTFLTGCDICGRPSSE